MPVTLPSNESELSSSESAIVPLASEMAKTCLPSFVTVIGPLCASSYIIIEERPSPAVLPGTTTPAR
ncbi:hypothetical protein D3C72_2465030 [compost metagenome]